VKVDAPGGKSREGERVDDAVHGNVGDLWGKNNTVMILK